MTSGKPLLNGPPSVGAEEVVDVGGTVELEAADGCDGCGCGGGFDGPATGWAGGTAGVTFGVPALVGDDFGDECEA